MKIVGALFIVAASFVFGFMRRSGYLKEELLLKKLSELLYEIRDNIEFRSNALKDVIINCAVNDKYADLDFLPLTLEKLDSGETLKVAITNAFEESDCAAKLKKSEGLELIELFTSMGSDVEDVVIQNIDYVISRLNETKQQLSEQNKKQKGYYETLYTLAGAAAAVALL